ncbi:MAG: hypothetical protein U1F35_04345 [Steroidobacteraceae bacterium]
MNRSSASSADRLNRAAKALALCVLADSAIEHYRGSFHNRAMLAPLISATLEVATGVRGPTRGGSSGHWRSAAHALAIATGLIGTAFHAYNITKRSGGVSFLNLFYAAPIGAPAALVFSGLLGAAAQRIAQADPSRGNGSSRPPRLAYLPAGKALAALTGAGIAGSVAEAALLHFRGAYHNPAMYLPVVVPPAAAAMLGYGAISSSPRIARWTRRVLRAVGALGIVGAAFHAVGLSRGMGGVRNWTQNLLNGPPLPAPPSFTALALAGLVALELQEAER